MLSSSILATDLFATDLKDEATQETSKNDVSKQEVWMKDTVFIKKTLDYIVIQEYKKAENNAKLLIDKYPTNEVGYYLYTSILATQMMDFESKKREKDFYSVLDKVYKIINSKPKKDRTMWDKYFQASIKIIESGYKVNSGSYTAVFGGKSAMGDVKKLYKEHDNNPDLAFYSGFYFYAMSKVWEKFSWMGVDNSEDITSAIELLKQSAKESIFSEKMSAQTLINVYFENGQFEEAEKEGKKFLKEFPQSRATKWAMAKMYKLWKKPEQSIVYYKELLAYFDTVIETYPYNYFNICDELSKLYFELNDKENSKKYANLAVENIKKLSKGYDGRIDKFVENCKDRLEDIE